MTENQARGINDADHSGVKRVRLKRWNWAHLPDLDLQLAIIARSGECSVFTVEDMVRYLAAAVFYPMLWLRGFVLAVGRLASGVAIIGAVAIGLVSLLTRHRLWLPAGLSVLAGFIIFLLMQLYDAILFWLNPSGRTLILYQ